MRRLSKSGFKKDFVRSAILPDWWDETCKDDPSLLPDVEIRIARFLGFSLSSVRDLKETLAPPFYPNAKLRRVREINRDRLAPSIYAGIKIAEAVIRSLRNPETSPTIPPSSGTTWRSLIKPTSNPVSLDHILNDLWGHGIPVIPIDVLPEPNYQGAACIAEGRPVILIGHKHDEPGHLAFIIAHETGHIVFGDCTLDHPVVDEEVEVFDDIDIEKRADLFASETIIGNNSIPHIHGSDYRQLAKEALQKERDFEVDADSIIFAWALRTGNFQYAKMAIKALGHEFGARKLLRKYFDRYVNLDAATESDRSLLRCVYGEPELNAAID
jgi:hypothetical protein